MAVWQRCMTVDLNTSTTTMEPRGEKLAKQAAEGGTQEREGRPRLTNSFSPFLARTEEKLNLPLKLTECHHGKNTLGIPKPTNALLDWGWNAGELFSPGNAQLSPSSQAVPSLRR